MIQNNRLRAARALKGLTQLQLADLLGVREIEVSRLETGRARPTPEVKRRIAEILGKQPFEIFDS